MVKAGERGTVETQAADAGEGLPTMPGIGNHLGRGDMTGTQWTKFLARMPTEGVESLLGLWMLLWGLWVALPWWDVSALAPSVYQVLLMFAKDESVLGGINMSIGMGMLSGVYRDHRATRFVSCLCCSSVLFLYVVAFFLSDWRSPAFLLWGVSGLFAGLAASVNGERMLSHREAREREAEKAKRRERQRAVLAQEAMTKE